jgi:hypothetical protein
MHSNQRSDGRSIEPAIDELIRRRFARCQSLPLFSDPPRHLHGFFEASQVGRQLHLLESAVPLMPRGKNRLRGS